jgi:hypothetical protein
MLSSPSYRFIFPLSPPSTRYKMSTIVVSPTHTSFLAKDVFSQYRNAPESSLIALTLPLPAMTPLSPDSATYNCRGIQTTTSTPESLADMAEEAIRLSRQTLGQLDTRTGTSEIVKDETPSLSLFLRLDTSFARKPKYLLSPHHQNLHLLTLPHSFLKPQTRLCRRQC